VPSSRRVSRNAPSRSMTAAVTTIFARLAIGFPSLEKGPGPFFP
jgi:hypothetical protein